MENENEKDTLSINVQLRYAFRNTEEHLATASGFMKTLIMFLSANGPSQARVTGGITINVPEGLASQEDVAATIRAFSDDKEGNNGAPLQQGH